MFVWYLCWVLFQKKKHICHLEPDVFVGGWKSVNLSQVKLSAIHRKGDMPKVLQPTLVKKGYGEIQAMETIVDGHNPPQKPGVGDLMKSTGFCASHWSSMANEPLGQVGLKQLRQRL